jgi:hypothetical protein
MAALAIPPKLQFFDANGDPLVGGKLYSYAAGTSTPLATYTDASGAMPNSNPVILDSRGEASVWLGTPQYKLKLTSATDVEVWTVDNIDGFAALAELAAPGGASQIGFEPYSYLSSTNVQAAVSELVDDLAAVQGAGRVGFTATGPVTASTVQAAIAQLATQVGYGSAYADLFSGDGVATSFTLSANPGNQAQLDVSVAGVTQRPGIDFTWTSGTTINFTSPPAAGTDNVLVRYVEVVPVGTYDQTIAALLAEDPGLILDWGNATDYILAFIDSASRRLAAWTADGTMLAKLGVALGVANGLTFTRNSDLTYTLSLGTTQGELPIGNSLAKGSYPSDDYLWGVTDSVGRRVLTVHKNGTVEGLFTVPEIVTASTACAASATCAASACWARRGRSSSP